MPETGFELSHVERLIGLVEKCGLSELRITQGDRSIRIKGGSAPSAPAGRQADVAAAPLALDGVAVASPMVGVYYRSPGPEQPPFIEVGDHVEVGQTVGLIEAMKVFSEVPAEVAGTVVAIPAENGQLVKPGDALVVVAPGGPAAETQPETA
ncbi:MAG: acetyl-CoA carboxylase biotin carboxyl carrier protein [Armatimonadetes bacterium]|nr:acetyl-CoA carboxylase biotin carboxyl carrier protein [Armatimonadota bacterium]